MRLYNLLDGVEVLQTNATRFDVEIKGVTSRSEEVGAGYIFVCIEGMKTDGHAFAETARCRGAVLLVVSGITDTVLSSGLPYVMVKNTRAVLAQMCAAFCGNPQKALKLIGITGTNGKTSTCRILAEIYRANGRNVRTLGTLDGGLTTPDPEELYPFLKKAFDCGADTVIMEASSHGLFFDKLYGMGFTTALFTNLTPEHLDIHSDMTEYALAKAKLFSSAVRGVYNLDDESFEKVSSLARGRKYTYSLENRNADFYADGLISYGSRGFEYRFVTTKESFIIRSELCGSFNVYNTLAAASAAYADGSPSEAIQKGIGAVKSVKGRLERVEAHDIPLEVYIDYAHTPDALEKLLTCVRGFRKCGQRIILLFGCGGDRDKSKRSVMGRIASRLADTVIVTADNSRSEDTADIINGILKGIDKERPYAVIEKRADAIEYAVNVAREGDIILLAGKGHEEYEIDSFGKRYFNEKEIALSAINKRFKGK